MSKGYGHEKKAGLVMDFDMVFKWLGAIGLALSIVNLSWTLVSRGAKDVTDKIEKHESKLTDHDRRIQSCEADIVHLPKAQEFHQLQLQVTRMEGHSRATENDVKAIARTVNRIDDTLRSGG